MAIAVRRFRLETHHFAGLYWVLLAMAIMPLVALSDPMEFFGVALIIANLTAAFFFPKARAPLLLAAILLYPRTMEYNPAWSWVLSLREPAKDIRMPEVVSLLDLAVVVTALAVLLPKLYRREPIRSYGNGWGLAYGAVYFVCILFSFFRYNSPHDCEFIAATNFVRMLLVWLVFVNSDEEGWTKRLSIGFFACGMIASLSGISRYVFSGPMTAGEQWEARAAPFNMNANSFAATMVMMGLFGAVLLCIGKVRWERWLGLALFVSSALGAGVSLSRSGIGIFALIATWLLFRYRKGLLLVWLGAVGMVVLWIATTPDVNGRIELFQSGVAVLEDDVRELIYQQTFSMLRHNWLMGVGPYRYYDASIPYVPTGIIRNLAHSHSMLLQPIMDAGVIGALFAWLVFFAFLRRARNALRETDPDATGLLTESRGSPLMRPVSRPCPADATGLLTESRGNSPGALTQRLGRETGRIAQLARGGDHVWRVGAAYGLFGALIMQLTDANLIDYRFFGSFLALVAVLIGPGKWERIAPTAIVRRISTREKHMPVEHAA